MDDEQYRRARSAIDQPRCLYEKAIQYRFYGCRYAQSISLGEREAMHCSDRTAHANCEAFYLLSLAKSGFALHQTRLPQHLTFNKAMQVQIGGLNGAMRLAGRPVAQGDKESGNREDVADCLDQLKATTADFKELNFSDIVPAIQQFSLPGRRRRRDK